MDELVLGIMAVGAVIAATRGKEAVDFARLMAGLFAILAACLAFVVPLAVPLFAANWRSLLIMAAAAAAFFTWLHFDVADGSSLIGEFLGGLMLVGFAFGAIARFAMLLGRRPRD
mgnify:CR=1 FL=1